LSFHYNQPKTNNNEKLRLIHGLAYALPFVGVTILHGPMSLVHGIYAKYFGVSLTSVAMILLLARLFDAVSDPLVGYFSDLYCANGGGRKPFVVSGALLMVVASYFLFVPPEGVSATYLMVSYFAFYFSFTLINIPHLAWGGEIVSDSSERSKVFAWRGAGGLIGFQLFAALPLLPFFPSDEFTPQTLKYTVILAGCLVLPCLYLCVKKVPDGYGVEAAKPKYNIRYGGVKLWTILISNIPFCIWFAAFFLANFGGSLWFGLQFIVIDSYLGLGHLLPQTMLIGFTVSLSAMVVAVKLAAQFGKLFVWSFGLTLQISGYWLMGELVLGEAGFQELLWMVSLVYFGSGIAGIMAQSLLTDIADYGAWKSGLPHGGLYFSTYALLEKTCLAMATAVGLGIAAAYGFDPAAHEHTKESVWGLRFASAWLPVIFVIVSLLFIAKIPINKRRHMIIRRRLEATVPFRPTP